jgi:branched-chain amino acid transport system permease protein
MAASSAHLPFVVALVVGGIAGSGVAVLIGIPAIRLRGLNLAISTLALALAVSALVVNPDSSLGKHLPDLLPRPHVLAVDLEDERVFYYVTTLVLALAVVACLGVRRSRAGRVLIASRDNESAAQAFGVNLVRVRLMAFAVSGFLAGSAGALFAYHEHGVKAAAFGPGTSVGMFLMVVIGGLGSIAGPLLGAAYFGALNLAGNETLTSLGTGLGAIVVLVAVQGGLAGAAAAARDAMLRRVALRQRILVPSLFEDSRGKRLDAPAPVNPKRRAGGGSVFVPPRYRVLQDQWGLNHHGEG